MANELEKTLLGKNKRSVNNTVDKNSTYIEQKKLHKVYITSQEPESPTDGELWFDTTGNNIDLYPPKPLIDVTTGEYGPIPNDDGTISLEDYAMYYIADYTNITELPENNILYLKEVFTNPKYKVVDTSYMFYSCRSLVSIDVSYFNTSEVGSMTSMFNLCTSLTQLDLSSFNTSNVSMMDDLFNTCTNLTYLNLTNWNTSKVGGMRNMLRDCNSLTKIDGILDMNSCISSYNWIFENCPISPDTPVQIKNPPSDPDWWKDAGFTSEDQFVIVQ